MDNIIYRTTIKPVAASDDGETPTLLTLTKEVNGYAIILSREDGEQIIEWHKLHSRDVAIEHVVDCGRRMREAAE